MTKPRDPALAAGLPEGVGLSGCGRARRRTRLGAVLRGAISGGPRVACAWACVLAAWAQPGCSGPGSPSQSPSAEGGETVVGPTQVPDEGLRRAIGSALAAGGDTQVRQLTSLGMQMSAPSVAASGDVVFSAIVSLDPALSRLFLTDMAADQTEPLTEGYDLWPAFSPDGTRVLYTRTVEGSADLYVLELDSGQQRRLTTTPGYDGNGAWSRDGQEIAFVTDRDGDREVYVMTSEGLDPRNVSRASGEDSSPSW